MKTINKDQGNETRYFEIIKTGERLYGLMHSWDAKIDFENGTYISISERDEYVSSALPTINDLVSSGIIEARSNIDELRITQNEVDVQDLDAVVSYAKEHGFNVEREMLEYNLAAWENDHKSGCRGSECHVFTPCGCNPLSFTISKLDEIVDWQTTYCA